MTNTSKPTLTYITIILVNINMGFRFYLCCLRNIIIVYLLRLCRICELRKNIVWLISNIFSFEANISWNIHKLVLKSNFVFILLYLLLLIIIFPKRFFFFRFLYAISCWNVFNFICWRGWNTLNFISYPYFNIVSISLNSFVLFFIIWSINWDAIKRIEFLNRCSSLPRNLCYL